MDKMFILSRLYSSFFIHLGATPRAPFPGSLLPPLPGFRRHVLSLSMVVNLGLYETYYRILLFRVAGNAVISLQVCPILH